VPTSTAFEPRIAARLPFQFDEARLLRDLRIADDFAWTAHFNRNDYEGEWSGLALRSASGRTDDIFAHPDPNQCYRATALLGRCDYFREVFEMLAFNIRGARLLSLSPNSVIKAHRDRGLGYEFGEFRLHIPIATSRAVSFWVDEIAIPMSAGECWYLNFDRLHRVENASTARRVHLVVDGVRDDTSDKVFLAAGVPVVAGYDDGLDDEAKARMLDSLRRLDLPAARELIERLEKKTTLSADRPAE
jgi:hypothetical protein